MLKIAEKQLHQIWQNQEFETQLKSLTDEDIEILNAGSYNENSAGPDFRHARIKIGRLTFVGDVEIDSDYSDWKKHGHNINKNYNKVILHISLTNKYKQSYVYTSEGRKVVSIPVENFIVIDNLKEKVKLAGKVSERKVSELKCTSEIHIVEKELIEKTIRSYGISRFQNKCTKVFNRLKELKFISQLELKEPVIRYELSKEFREKEFSHDDFKDKAIWKQLLYELIFEALGYSKNKLIMKKLAQNLRLEYLEKFNLQNNDYDKLESIFFNVAGLLPGLESLSEHKDSEYIKYLASFWEENKNNYDGKFFDETQWHFLGQRPQNFPTVRIAGGVRLVEELLHHNLAGTIIKKFSEIHSPKVLINSIRSLFIIKANGYWRDHFIFDKKSKIKLNYIIGLSRADEIFINVLLPYLSIYFDIFGNIELSKKVLRIYNEYEQRLDNKIIREVSNGLKIDGLGKKTIYAQGMIELYRNYCTKNKCLECNIGQKIFN